MYRFQIQHSSLH